MVPVSYLQTDGRWGGNDYSAPGEKTTIAKAGCGPTCVAMILATLIDKSITPADSCKWSLEHGYKAPKQGTYYSYISAHLAEHKIKATRINTTNIYKSTTKTAEKAHAKALEAINKGNWVIACMGPGNWTSSGHYILVYDINGIGELMIRDPASLKVNRIRGRLKAFQNEVKYYWIVDISNFTEDDEVVEKRKIEILGKEYTADGIYKDGLNYISPKVLAEAGFEVTSKGSEPIVSMPNIKLNINGAERVIKGVISNGTTYAGLRELLEVLGYKVDWKDGIIHISE